MNSQSTSITENLLGATLGELHHLNDAMLPYHHTAIYLLWDTGINGG